MTSSHGVSFPQVVLDQKFRSLSGLFLRLCGETLSGGVVVLVVVAADGEEENSTVGVTVHCEKLTVASMLLKQLTAALKKEL